MLERIAYMFEVVNQHLEFYVLSVGCPSLSLYIRKLSDDLLGLNCALVIAANQDSLTAILS